MLCLDTPQSGPCSREQAFDTGLIPSATTTYQPLSNEDLVHMVELVAQKHGLTLKNEQLGWDLKGMRFFGVMDVEGKDFMGGAVQLMVGFCNSYNRSMSARVCIGGKVFVCSNRAFHAYTDEETGADGMAIHSHRRFISDGLFHRVEGAFSTIDSFRRTQENFYQRLTDTSVTKDDAYALIVRAAKADVINKTKILTIAEEWDRQGREPLTPNQAEGWHPEFKERNAFSLFNAFTEVEKVRAKKNPVLSHMQTMALTQFFHRQYHLN